MKAALAAFSLVTLVPAMADGALVSASGGALVLSLCAGGSMTIQSGGPATPRPANAPCCAKGYRDNDRRRRLTSGAIDPAQ